MFKWNDEFNLSIDCKLFEYIQDIENDLLTLDELHFTVLAMIGAIAIHNKYAPCIYTTLDNILATMAQDVNFKAKPKIKTGIMNGFNILKKHGVIKMNEMFTGDKKQIVCIECNEIGHSSEDWYFQIGRKELATIIKGTNVPHHLIAIMCNECSRFNTLAYISFDNGEWHKSYYDSGASVYKKLSCWASQEVLTTSWINIDGQEIVRKNKWDVEQSQFSKYRKQLTELGIFDRYIVSEPGKKISYYFRPIHRDCVIWSLDLLSSQQDYVIKQEQEEPTPTVKGGGSFVQARRKRKASEAFR